MLTLERNHDFQVFISPKNNKSAEINPPSFNWPQKSFEETYNLELESIDGSRREKWEKVSSPFQQSEILELGEYRWRLTDSKGKTSEWMTFTIDELSQNYLAPRSKEIFEMAKDRDQFLMYFEEDIDLIKGESTNSYERLKETAKKVDLEKITYPSHYRRGEEEGKRKAINNVREWIDRDLMALTLLYKIWDEKESGDKAVEVLLRLAEWSPEGPASLLRPCTWGDEVGCSLARNMYLAYHWLSPLLTESEKDFVRPMLIRIAYQMEERLNQDEFKQYPGHSHTSRLPAYLGLAAIALHKEYDEKVCERWLDYALMIYRGILPFYGGTDGSWAEGPFYSSSYSKWFHPFFLTVERLSDFSFYNHPFYKNYYKFAMDFVATEHEIHPFGDGFWCRRDGDEWPGFFAQNPLRIYADRFGDEASKELCKNLENQIDWYRLHLLDVVPTVKQIEFSKRPLDSKNSQSEESSYSKYYNFAGFGKSTLDDMEFYFRASQFGNSSHRHGDQGNFAFIDSENIVLAPSGSYGYKFGSKHHKEWTRATKAHNLPLIEGAGQILDDESATASVLVQKSGPNWHFVQLDLSSAYKGVDRFVRNLIVIEGKGLIVCDKIDLEQEASIQWRLHSHLEANTTNNNIVLRTDEDSYGIRLPQHKDIKPTVICGYEKDNSHGERVVSDALEDVYHIEWNLEKKKEHLVVATCEKDTISYLVEDNNILKINLDKELMILDTESGRVKFVNN